MAKSKPEDLLPYKDTGVPIGIVKRNANLFPIKKKLDKQYGEGVWGLDEVADYIQKRGKKTPPAQPEKQSRETRLLPDEKLSTEDETERRYKEYLGIYPDATSNDRVSLRQLAAIETQILEVAEWRRDKNKVGSVRELADLGKLEISLSTEHRQLQESLGIGRSQRENSGDAEEERQRMVREASEFLNGVAIHIQCPHCFSERKLNQGFIVFHFKEHVPWEWKSRCPNPDCGKEIEIRSAV